MITFVRRPLSDQEIEKIVQTISHTPTLVYVAPSIWKSFYNPYVVMVNQEFAGVCQIYENGNWAKIGPIILLPNFQGHGVGKQLIARIIVDYRHKKLFLTTTNSILKHIVKGFEFKKIRSFFLLPIPIAIFLIVQFFEYLRAESILAYIQKMNNKSRGEMSFFIRSTR